MNSSGNMLIQQRDPLSNFVGSFEELRTAEELFDVTLACEDETVEAHKVIISACSPFFRHVLTKTKQNHPFIYLKGVLYKDLAAILDFIYNGETQVPAEDVSKFIEAANELKIKGLSEVGLEDTNLDNKKLIQESSEKKNNEPVSEAISEEGINTSSEEEVVSELVNACTFCIREFKTKPFLQKHVSQFHRERSNIKEENVEVTLNENEQNESLRMEISKRIKKVVDIKEGSMWRCTVCSKMLKKKEKLQYHVEIHLDGFTHKCLHCAKICKTRGSLSAHNSLYHRGDK